MLSPDQLRAAVLIALLAMHAVGAGLLGWRAPHGFDPFTLMFFTGEALPLLVCVGAAVSIFVRSRAVAALGLAGLWIGAALTALLLFPFSTWRFVLIAAPLGLALGVLAWRAAEAHRRLAIALGLVSGFGWTAAQRAPEPSTHPLGGAIGAKQEGRIIPVHCGGLSLTVEPVLTFESCADDRFWALWAVRRCPAPDDFATQLRTEGAITVIEAQTRFDAPVFSHLNSFGTVSIERGDLRAAIAGGAAEPFSPHDGPSRFAWLRADGVLETARATENEKGPFIELATAQLKREALIVVLSDADGPACRLSFDTWAAQASVAPSPTAGWGVAQNALELLDADDASASAVVISLAATSIGRGWDTVGHAPGTYRNVIRIEALR